LRARTNTKVKVTRQYEENYTTNLDWEKTLLNLIGVINVVPPGPPGIRQLRWKDTFCGFGRAGGLNIHSSSEEEMNEFISLLQSRGIYRDGQEPEWTLNRSTHGKKWYKYKMESYKSQMQNYRAQMQYYKQKYEELKSEQSKTSQ
jgi:hypothetical protein